MVNQETGSHRSSTATLKFLCSYGGKILPRRPDGRLRYVGGLTRILAVDRSVSCAELMVKLVEFCGFSVAPKCELPGGDLETLVSIKSDEDLANLIEEYDEASLRSRSSSSSPGAPFKIRAVLFEPRSGEQASPPPSPSPSAASSLSSSPHESPRRRIGERSFSPRIVAGVGCRSGSPMIGHHCNFYGPGQPRVPCAAAVHCRRNYCQ
ncbi:uncharacterized protein LOC115741425 [Rhodamnia argentea]|uniref:Uncharacterized protein LOC115741425 n=1 Tax=Rhodamnia argentea TaxID=178133 RepID=A0A8B8PAZ9_9MYRT|nr:uncharacterized protein LOC115741425 [Rhodamnia argentea]